MFFIVDDHGTPLGKYETLEAAEAALERLHSEDPLSIGETGIIEIDPRTGKRVGGSLSLASPA